MEKPIGSIIREVLDRSGMKLKVFAERIGTTRQNVYKIFEKHSIGTERLQRISEVLEYDFFQHFGTSETLAKKGPASRRIGSGFRYANLVMELDAALLRIGILEQRLADKDEIIALLRNSRED